MDDGDLPIAEVAVPARPSVRPHWTILVWGGATLLGGLLLPWARAERELGSLIPGTTGLLLLGDRPLIGVAMAAALLAVITGGLPLPQVRRGQIVLWLGIFGLVAAAFAIVMARQPMGPGALLVLLGHLSLLGTGLALSGALNTDPFTASAILWVAAFVAIFILWPLGQVLVAAIVVKGHLSFDVIRETTRSPGFLLLNRPGTPHSEVMRALVVGGIGGAVLGAAAALRRHSWRSVIIWGIGGGVGMAALAMLYGGFGAVRNSIILAVVVGVFSTGLGFLFALLGERSRLPTRRLLGPLSILPIITPPFVLGLAMIYLFGRRGFITHQLLGLNTNMFFGPLGVGFAQVLAFTPIAYLVLQGVVRALDAAMEEAAETLGASRWHILRTVIWPLARPGIANAFLLVAIESLADFGNPIIVGGGAPFLATEVFFAIIGRFNPSEAAVYGITLLGMTLTVFLIQRFWIGRRGYVTVTGKPSAGGQRTLPPAMDYGATAIFLVWVLITVLLYGSVFSGSITKLWGFDYRLTFEHIRALSPTGWQVFWTSTRLAAIAAVPSTLLGFLIGFLVTRVQFPGRSALEFGSMLSFAVPGTVMGIGYILAFNRGPLLLTGTEVILILAFVFRNMPVGIRAGVAAIHQLDRSIEEASTMLGAGTPTTLRRIVMPLIRPALLSGLVFAFVRAMTAVSQVIFLISPRHNLATTQILSYVEYGSQGRGAALASLLTLFMAVVVLALYLVTNRLDPRLVRDVAVAGAPIASVET